MYPEIPKPIKRQMRELAGQAYETALSKALADLESDFGRWRRGEIDAFELNEQIHQFHNGRAREIYNRFADVRNSTLVGITAYSVAAGLVDEKSVSPEVMQYIEPALKFHRQELAMGESG